jgi:DNA-binding PadR family transcriptional regulator
MREGSNSPAGDAERGFLPGPEMRGGRGGQRHGEHGGKGHHVEGRWFGGAKGDFEGHGYGRGFGRRMRMFDSGGVKLALLKLLSEEPAHGYQLIKKMEQKLAGGYTPSAGAIYPTLTLLEEEGLIAASLQENKKIYSVTSEGAQFLESNKARVEALFAQLEEASRGFARGRSPELMRAFTNLRSAVSARVSRGNATEEQIRKMAAAIDTAAKTIDEL